MIRVSYPVKHPWHIETVKRFFASHLDATAFITDACMTDVHQQHNPFDGSLRQRHEYKTAEVMLLLIDGHHYELGTPVDDYII